MSDTPTTANITPAAPLPVLPAQPTGEVIGGPAETPLEEVKLADARKTKESTHSANGKSRKQKATNGKAATGSQKPARPRSAASK